MARYLNARENGRMKETNGEKKNRQKNIGAQKSLKRNYICGYRPVCSLFLSLSFLLEQMKSGWVCDKRAVRPRNVSQITATSRDSEFHITLHETWGFSATYKW